MEITMLYAGVLAIGFLALSVRVVQMRSGKTGIGLGDGGNSEMLRRMRGHANFAEYVPLILIMMAMLESNGLAKWAIHALGSTLLVARILHGIALSYTRKWIPGRFLGALLTFVLLLVGGGLCIWQAL